NNIMQTLDEINEKVKSYKKEIINDGVIKSRFIGKGIISKNLGEKYCAVGPTARASKISMDVRSTGYEGYGSIRFNPILGAKGDSMERLIVRLEEISQSVGIIKQALSLIKKPAEKMERHYIKRAEGHARIEAPRGELFYFLSVKHNNVLRAKIKTPTLNNFPILKPLIVGSELGDLPIIVASIDPCIGCMERVMVAKNGTLKILSKKDLMEACGYEHKHEH
ncbi:MAG: hypothetical protein PHS81_00560, partial [Candidatus Nanoarchaeia archaeon]|nr:hypothetical protein [Candidatus Nanoarchaeia archaeon]